MERLNDLLNDAQYQHYLTKNKILEKERIFCKHDLQHFLDVARLAYLINLEQSLGFSKEVIYAAALLHDIGRFMEYEEKISHEKASWQLALPLLEQYGFDETEKALLKEAILGHRKEGSSEFGQLIYKADKLSRTCLACEAQKECYWDSQKKNLRIVY